MASSHPRRDRRLALAERSWRLLPLRTHPPPLLLLAIFLLPLILALGLVARTHGLLGLVLAPHSQPRTALTAFAGPETAGQGQGRMVNLCKTGVRYNDHQNRRNRNQRSSYRLPRRQQPAVEKWKVQRPPPSGAGALEDPLMKGKREELKDRFNRFLGTAAMGMTMGLASNLLIPPTSLVLPPIANAEQYDMTKGTTTFKTTKYLGTWYEVASMKKGFAGTGQEDCHCTQGMYQLDPQRNRIVVNTFCAHGGPDGRISGIQGIVKCLGPMEGGMMKEIFLNECKLRFPAVPFIPAEPYDIIATDYKSYAIVQGSLDKSFVQIYSRKPKPGPVFIENQKKILKERGFNVDEIKDTPQDCDNKMIGQMMTEMMQTQMEKESVPSGPFVMKAPPVKTPKLDGEIEIDTELFKPKFIITEIKDLAKLIGETVASAVLPNKVST